MDFVDGLPKYSGYTTIIVVDNRLTKSAHLVLLTHPYTAWSMATKFIDSVIKLHGILHSILNDRDPVFMSLFCKFFWQMAGTKLKNVNDIPSLNGWTTEVVNCCIEQFLRCFVQTHLNLFIVGWVLVQHELSCLHRYGAISSSLWKATTTCSSLWSGFDVNQVPRQTVSFALWTPLGLQAPPLHR